MKHKLFLCAAVLTACAFSMNVNAQLEVTWVGDVTASKNLQIVKNVAIGDTVDAHVSLNIKHVGSGDSSPYYGIKSHIKTSATMPTSPTYGVLGWADASSSSTLLPNCPLVGVFGIAYKSYIAPTAFAAGIAGITHYYGGIGVYGGIRTGISVPTSMPSNEKYAGYFDGTVKVNGTVIATAVSTTSDERQKENIQEIPSYLSKNLNRLRPVSYTLKQDSVWKYDTDAKELQGVHYGLLAQEVEKVYPELVYKRGDNLSINYTELIPLLLKTVQELSMEVEMLKAQNKKELTKQ
jgi:hypothetical protein